ncbi:hypothetical protein [Paraferrimonas sp. SM1919]|uniref:hypothetical protein n=1 Tax=Paraferrimonas sp. SM1919 TaxID=2662263 RepID=UPI0013D5689E|nr:hypothetical protein [Paraferrimonas sp. SM1919]
MKIKSGLLALCALGFFAPVQAEHHNAEDIIVGSWICDYSVMGFKDKAYINYRDDKTMDGKFAYSYPGLHGKGAFNLNLQVSGTWFIVNKTLTESYQPNKTELSVSTGFTVDNSANFAGKGPQTNKATIIRLTDKQLQLKETDGEITHCKRQ